MLSRTRARSKSRNKPRNKTRSKSKSKKPSRAQSRMKISGRQGKRKIRGPKKTKLQKKQAIDNASKTREGYTRSSEYSPDSGESERSQGPRSTYQDSDVEDYDVGPIAPVGEEADIVLEKKKDTKGVRAPKPWNLPSSASTKLAAEKTKGKGKGKRKERPEVKERKEEKEGKEAIVRSEINALMEQLPFGDRDRIEQQVSQNLGDDASEYDEYVERKRLLDEYFKTHKKMSRSRNRSRSKNIRSRLSRTKTKKSRGSKTRNKGSRRSKSRTRRSGVSRSLSTPGSLARNNRQKSKSKKRTGSKRRR